MLRRVAIAPWPVPRKTWARTNNSSKVKSRYRILLQLFALLEGSELSDFDSLVTCNLVLSLEIAKNNFVKLGALLILGALLFAEGFKSLSLINYTHGNTLSGQDNSFTWAKIC